MIRPSRTIRVFLCLAIGLAAGLLYIHWYEAHWLSRWSDAYGDRGSLGGSMLMFQSTDRPWPNAWDGMARGLELAGILYLASSPLGRRDGPGRRVWKILCEVCALGFLGVLVWGQLWIDQVKLPPVKEYAWLVAESVPVPFRWLTGMLTGAFGFAWFLDSRRLRPMSPESDAPEPGKLRAEQNGP